MASSGYYDADGYWHEPDDPRRGREEAPGNPDGGGYTVPTQTPAPTEETSSPPAGTPPATTPPPGTTWTPPQYNGPMAPDLSWLTDAPMFDAPMFDAPPAFAYDAFVAPDAQSVLNDPGYQFRRDEGAQAVRQAAASMGKLRTGGTIKDLLNYNQNFASREYGNVYDRSLGAYKTNYGNAANTYQTNYGVTRDVFEHNYQAAKDRYQPQLLSWQEQMQARQRAAEEEYQRQYDLFKYQNPSATDIFNAGNR